MNKAEQIDIRSAITKVLPYLAVSIWDILVETTEDFPFIQEADLLSTLTNSSKNIGSCLEKKTVSKCINFFK